MPHEGFLGLFLVCNFNYRLNLIDSKYLKYVILTCCTEQYPDAKYDPMARAASGHHHIPWAPNAVCSHTKTKYVLK